MTAQPLQILVASDSQADADLVAGEVRRCGREFEVDRVDCGEAMADALARGGWDLVVSAWEARFGPLAALGALEAARLEIPLIVLAGPAGEETVVEAMRAGAHDVVMRDRPARLTAAVERALGERRTHPAVRRRHDDLPEADKMVAIGSLAGCVAHDFNNILSVILSYTSLAIDRLSRGDPVRSNLVEVKAAAMRATELTRQLLAFSGQQLVQPRVVDLNQLLGDLEGQLRPLVGREIELALVARRDLAPVWVDPGLIEQAVTALVKNARDATPRGGRITIETANVVLDEQHAAAHPGTVAGPHVLLAVSDTGHGMEPATLARVFEPFFTTRRGRGRNGLGLSSVLGIVQQSGGSVTASSQPGAGTTFKLYLVAAANEVARAGEPEPSGDRLSGHETILLVEDDPILRGLARAVLCGHGYHVLDAEDGIDALLLSEQHSDAIDLLVTDMAMPRMSGRQLAERLQPERPEMRVVYMSGYTDDAAVRREVVESRVALLHKPLTPEALVRKIRETLDSAPRHRR